MNMGEPEVVLIHFNIFNNNFQHDLTVLSAFAPNKSFGQLLSISGKSFLFLKNVNSEFSYIEVRFTDQNSKMLRIEHKLI